MVKRVMDGKVSPANVFTYSKVKDVVNALKSGKVGMILIDEDIYRSQYKNNRITESVLPRKNVRS